MSKEAGLRAMREARYAARTAGSAPPARPAHRPAPVAPVAHADPGTADPAPPTDAVCGHRSMNGRTCTREQGHAAKSHRYG